MSQTVHAVFEGGPWGKQEVRWVGNIGPITVDDGVYEPTETRVLVADGDDWKIATVYRWKLNESS